MFRVLISANARIAIIEIYFAEVNLIKSLGALYDFDNLKGFVKAELSSKFT